jgi:hypothetical protein
MERVRSAGTTAGQTISGLGSLAFQRETRSQRIKRRIMKFGRPVLIVGSIAGAIGILMHKSERSGSPAGAH